MTFNIQATDTSSEVPGQPNQQPNTPDNGGTGADHGITAEKLNEILKRDEHAQKHIKTLEEENTQMRDNFNSLQEKLEKLQGQLNSRDTLEQLLSRKNTSTDTSNLTEDHNNMNTPTNTVSQDDVNSLVTQGIEGYMKQQQQETNLSKAKTSLNELFKDKADDHVNQVSSNNGISFDEAMTMAKTNPTLFENLFVKPFKKPGAAIAPTMGSQSTSSVPTNSNEITMDYWNKLRRENPNKYFSVETQKQFHQWFHNNK